MLELFGQTGLLSGLALLAWLVAAVAARRRHDLLPLVLLAAGPVVVLAAAGVVAHVLGGRYVLYAVLVVALALGLASRTAPGVALAALVLLGAANALQWARTDYVQEDLPSAAAWLVAHDQDGDGLLYSPDHARAAFLPGLETTSAAVARQDLAADVTTDRTRLEGFYLAERSADDIRAELARHPRVWVIGYADDPWRPTPNTGGDTAAQDLAGWRLLCTQAFGQVRLQLFSSPSAAVEPVDCRK